MMSLLACLGMASAEDIYNYDFSTTAAYTNTNGGTYQGVMFKLTDQNPLITMTDNDPVQGLRPTLILDSITIQLRNTAAGTCADGRYLYIADSNNKLLAISDFASQTTQGGNLVFNFSETADVLTSSTANKENMLILNTNEMYYAYFGKDDAVLTNWSIGETTIPNGQVYSVQLAAVAATGTTSEWGLMNGGRQQQGSTGFTPAMTIAVHTPEPATATLSLLALAGLCARRKRH